MTPPRRIQVGLVAATTCGVAIAKFTSDVASAIALPLLDEDSHTVFVPPPRANRIDYGADMAVVGDRVLVVGVAPGVTAADVLMSDGQRLERGGVTPDEPVLPTNEDLRSNRDPVLARAVTLAGGSLSPEEAAKLFPTVWAYTTR